MGSPSGSATGIPEREGPAVRTAPMPRRTSAGSSTFSPPISSSGPHLPPVVRGARELRADRREGRGGRTGHCGNDCSGGTASQAIGLCNTACATPRRRTPQSLSCQCPHAGNCATHSRRPSGQTGPNPRSDAAERPREYIGRHRRSEIERARTAIQVPSRGPDSRGSLRGGTRCTVREAHDSVAMDQPEAPSPCGPGRFRIQGISITRALP